MVDDAVEATDDFVVLIVAYRSADKLERCLHAVAEHLQGRQVHVWDNSGPSDASVRTLSATFPGVRWHLNSPNIGFAAAVNALASMAPAFDMLLLNPDAEIRGSLPMTRAALREEQVAAAAPMVSVGSTELKTAHFLSSAEMPWDVAHLRPTLLNAVCGIALPPQRLRGTWFSDRYGSQPTEVTGYLTGACLAIRREAWDSLGHFNEEFFLYGEEADWQSRALSAGWRIRLASEVGVYHVAHGTVSDDSVESKRSEDLFRAGVALQLELRYGRWAGSCFIAAVSLIEIIKQRLRGQASPVTHAAVIVTIDPACESADLTDRIRTAVDLSKAGYEVTLISVSRLGTLPRYVPSFIRLIRRPWWWPSTGPERTPDLLVAGTTRRERAFSRMYRVRRARSCVQPDVALAIHDNVAGTRVVPRDGSRT